jgi:hypothetical protein
MQPAERKDPSHSDPPSLVHRPSAARQAAKGRRRGPGTA